jgi:hypothetical protein
MSETVTLESLRVILRELQAEQRTLRDENKLIRSTISDEVTLLMARIAATEEMLSRRLRKFEAHIDSRLDQLAAGDPDERPLRSRHSAVVGATGRAASPARHR